VLALALFVCACQLEGQMAWVDIVSFAGMIKAGAVFTIHILNRFPDVLKAFLIVSLYKLMSRLTS